MCQAFSCLITKSKKVYWKVGVDSHDSLHRLYEPEDPELKDDKEPPANTFARIEIFPANRDYLRPDKWVYQIDERVKPDWLNDSFEKPCREAFKKWKAKVYSSFDYKGVLKPIHPFKIRPPKITKKHLKVLLHWALVRDSVRDSVGASVGASVWDSVGASVGASVWASVGALVRDSVWDSVGAYTGTFFPNIKKWKYVNFKHKGYPFNDAVKLWKMGLVASFDGEKWRLHGGKKAKILWEGTVEELKKACK